MRRLRSALLVSCLAVAFSGSAHALACTGNVVLGEGPGRVITDLPNIAMDGVCINELIIDTLAEGANYRNHGEFVAALAQLTQTWARRGSITPLQRGRLLAAAAKSNVGRTIDVRVIAFNDFHGNIDGANLTFRSDSDGIFVATPNPNPSLPPTRSGVPAGGVDYMAGLVRELKAGKAHTVVVSAGDLIGASPLNSALFHDEPAIETMNRLGLEFNAVGNHEFDEGKDELLRMQNGGCHPTDTNSCQGPRVGTPYPFEGADFQFLAANVIDTTKGDTLFPAVGVKNFSGTKVAFIGMTLEATPTIVTPAGIAGLRFADEADTVNALIPHLKRQGINAIVVLIHEGGFVTGGVNGCTGIAGPIADIVHRLDNAVDLVISGHTHQAYNCSLPNSAGRPITVTSAGAFSRLLTIIDVRIDTATKEVAAVLAQNVVVDRRSVTPVKEISVIVAAYNGIVAPIANRVIGSITADLTRTSNAAGESSLGDAIADAQLAATSAPEKGGAVVAFMNPGGIRSDFTYPSSSAGEGNGNVTYGEAFTVQPFANTLVIKTMTGQQLYDLLEQQFAVGRILQVSTGFAYRTTFPSAGPDGKYLCSNSVTLNSMPIDRNARYRVTMNSFLASGGDGFSVFNAGTDQLGGDVDLDALAAYFATHSPVMPGSQNRILKGASCT